MGWFNKKYIYTEKILSEDLFKIYKETYTSRQKSDYDFLYIPESDDISVSIKDVKYFVDEIKKIL